MPIRSGATLIAALLLAATAAAGQDRLALVGGMLLDGYDVPPLHHAAVLIEGDRIAAVGRAAEMEIPPDAAVVDTRGRVMMPGMMDLHAHLAVLGQASTAAGSPGSPRRGWASRRSWRSRRSSSCSPG